MRDTHHHKLPIAQFDNGNCVKIVFHEFVFFAHKCQMFLNMYDASISK
jgi:hypothetical protein